MALTSRSFFPCIFRKSRGDGHFFHLPLMICALFIPCSYHFWNLDLLSQGDHNSVLYYQFQVENQGGMAPVFCCCSVAQSCLILCHPMELQHARLPCPSPIPEAYSNSCPLSRWCHPIISSSVIPFSSHLQSFPASGSLPMSQFFASGCQIIGVSASASVLPMNIQGLFLLGLTGLILQVQGAPKSLLQHQSSKPSIFQHSAFFTVQLSHPYMTTGKTTALTRQTFVGKVMPLLFNIFWHLVMASSRD